MTEKRVRVGLIGCGAIAQRHVQWFLACPECDIAALCDLSSDAVRARTEAVRALRPDAEVTPYSDYRDLLADSSLDGVAVLLPHALHHVVAKAALEAGKHVLVEKPMVTSVEQARDLIAVATRTDRRLAIGYQRSYLPEYAYVRRLIREGAFGQLRFITAHLEQNWYAHFRGLQETPNWRSDAAQAGGGQLVDSGSHTLAALLDVTGLTPTEVYAAVDTCDAPVDIDTAMVMRFAEGAIATVMIGGFGHSVTEVLRVVGDKSSARIFFRTVREQALELNGEVVDAHAVEPPSTPNRNFVDALVKRDTVRADAVLGLRVAGVTEAAYASARTHAPVTVCS